MNNYIASIAQSKRPVKMRRALRATYHDALYTFEVHGQSYPLRVGERSAAAVDLLKSHGAAGAAFITADNPASLELGQVHNTLAERALMRDLKGVKAQVFAGTGSDPAGSWSPESSMLVVGINETDAKKLARQYGQYAMLWIDADGWVSLVELAELDKADRYPLKVPPFGKVKIGFNWSGEWANLRLMPAEWKRILQGDKFSKRSRCGYYGETFALSWEFRNGTDLYVSYGDEGQTAYDDKLTGVSLTLEAQK